MGTLSKLALIRRPGPRLEEGLVTHLDRSPVNLALATEQWRTYVQALEANGWHTIAVEPADHCPDAVFIEDAAVVYGATALLCRPGAEQRRAEVPGVSAALVEIGYDVVEMNGTGTLDGGDVLKVGSTMYIGIGGRTNRAGVEEASRVFGPHGVTVVGVVNTRVLHLKSAVTALPDGTVIGYEPVVEDSTVFPDFVAMPEESGAHVVDLGEGRLLMAADCPRSTDVIRGLGYEPVVVDIGEFEKLEGCVTCLSIRLRDAPGPS